MQFKSTVCCFVDILKFLCIVYECDFTYVQVVIKIYLLTYFSPTPAMSSNH